MTHFKKGDLVEWDWDSETVLRGIILDRPHINYSDITKKRTYSMYYSVFVHLNKKVLGLTEKTQKRYIYHNQLRLLSRKK